MYTLQSELFSLFQPRCARYLIRGSNILDQSILKHISLTTMVHADDPPSSRAHQKSCFCSRAVLPRVINAGTTRGIAKWTPRACTVFLRRLPDTSAICSVQITIFTSRVYANGWTCRILFFFPLPSPPRPWAEYSCARLTLCTRGTLYSSGRDDKTRTDGAR